MNEGFISETGSPGPSKRTCQQQSELKEVDKGTPTPWFFLFPLKRAPPHTLPFPVWPDSENHNSIWRNHQRQVSRSTSMYHTLVSRRASQETETCLHASTQRRALENTDAPPPTCKSAEAVFITLSSRKGSSICILSLSFKSSSELNCFLLHLTLIGSPHFPLA